MKSYEMQGPSCGCSEEMDVEINSSICGYPSARSTAEAGYQDFLVKHELSHTWVHGQCSDDLLSISGSQCGWSMSMWCHKKILAAKCVSDYLPLALRPFKSLCYSGTGVQWNSPLMNGTVKHSATGFICWIMGVTFKRPACPSRGWLWALQAITVFQMDEIRSPYCHVTDRPYSQRFP